MSKHAAGLAEAEARSSSGRAVERGGVEGRLARLYGRTSLPSLHELDAQIRRLEFLRVVLGLVVVWRFGEIALSSRHYFDPTRRLFGVAISPELLMATVMVVLAVFFMVGFLTPVVTMVFAATVKWVDLQLSTGTLGTDVLMILMIFFIVVGSGRAYSLDSWIIRRDWRGISSVLAWPYRILGPVSESRLAAGLILTLAAYWLLNVGGLLFHVFDEYWQSGRTVEVVLTNSYMSRWWEPMRSLQHVVPELLTAFSVTAVVFQTIWQAFMLPLVFSKWGHRFVVLHGAVFIVISAAVLQLSYLPLVEAVLWLMLFSRVSVREPLVIYYDDRCRPCRRTVRALRCADPLFTYRWKPLSQNAGELCENGVDPEAARHDIHGVWGDRVFVGYRLYETMARRNPLLWPLWPVLVAARWAGFGPRAYRSVANRRGCSDARCPVSAEPVPDRAVIRVGGRSMVGRLLISVWAGVLVIFILTLPRVQQIGGEVGLPVERVPDARIRGWLRVVGMSPPNVFNELDLQLGDRWPVLYRRADDGPELVPLNGRDGQRLSYHDSDVIYFGNSLRWRRGAITRARYLARPHTIFTCRMERIALYDARLRSLEGPSRYHVEIWENDASDVEVPLSQRYQSRRLSRYAFEVDPALPISATCRGLV